MMPSKIVDEIIVDLNFPKERRKRSLFIVFSSREPHIEIVIDNIELVMRDRYGYEIVRLDAALKSGDSQFTELTKFLSTCTFAIVILDGFRPNVLFEYGVLIGLGKPTVVLLETDATIDLNSLFNLGSDYSIPNPKIDIDKHFSDVKDRVYIRYNKHDPKGFRTLIGTEYQKLKEQIEEEFIQMIFPNKDTILKELRKELTKLLSIFMKNEKDLRALDEENLKKICTKIDEIVAKNSLLLPPSYFFTIAQIYESFKNYQHALEIIEPYVNSKESKSTEQFLELKGHLLKELYRAEDALVVFDELIRNKPNIESYWHNKALLLEQLGRKNDALNAYKLGIENNKGCSNIHFRYGILLYEKKQSKEALRQFENALALNPNDSNYMLWKGKTCYKLNNKSDAFKIVKEAASLRSNNANVWFTLGQWEKDKTKALLYFEKAIKANPNHCGALCSKGALLSNDGKFNEAFKILWTMRDKCTRHQKSFCSNLILNILKTVSQMDKKLSEEQMKELLASVNGKGVSALRIRATALAIQGKYMEGSSLFKNALKKSPKDSTIWYDLACTYALMGDKVKSLKSLGKAILLNPSFAEDALKDKDLAILLSDSNFQQMVNTNSIIE